jgi:hypothetical protein
MGGSYPVFCITIESMSTAQYRRIIKGSWSNKNEQRHLDQQYQVEENTQEESNNIDTTQEEQ